MFFRLFSRAPRMTSALLAARAAAARHRDRLLAAQVLPGQRLVPVYPLPLHPSAPVDQLLRRPLKDHLPAVLAGAGPEIDQVVGDANRLFVVLDDDDGVAEIAQVMQRAEQRAVVALVQSDRRLVEHVEHAGQVRANLRGQPDALPLASRQRRRAAAEREVADADVVEEPQPILNFLEHASGDQVLALAQLEPLNTSYASLIGRFT